MRSQLQIRTYSNLNERVANPYLLDGWILRIHRRRGLHLLAWDGCRGYHGAKKVPANIHAAIALFVEASDFQYSALDGGRYVGSR